jgi:hypothetical protein
MTHDDSDKNSENKSDDVENIILSKHKVEGKHSLKYDSIFKGKKDEIIEDDDCSDCFSDIIKIQ